MSDITDNSSWLEAWDGDYYLIPEKCGCILVQLHNSSSDLPLFYDRYRKPCKEHKGLRDELSDKILNLLVRLTKSKISKLQSSIDCLENDLESLLS